MGGPERPSLPRGSWAIFVAGEQARCPNCNERIGDVVAARVTVRILQNGDASDGPALIEKCTGYERVRLGSGMWVTTKRRCGVLLEIKTVPLEVSRN